jgi:hypothetical protein
VIGSVGSSAADFCDSIHLLKDLDLSPFLKKSLPLQEFAGAWELFRTHQFLKIMLEVNPSLNSLRPQESSAKATERDRSRNPATPAR